MNGCANRLRKTNLLTAAEEYDLATTVQEGLCAAEEIDSATVPSDDLDELEAKVRAGQIAKGRFVEANMGLVRSIANRFLGRGLEFEDLVQEGVFGLMRAAEKFDPSMGNRFSTYASWWIRQSMGKAVNSQSRTIRVPDHVAEKLGKIARKESEIYQEYGYKPDDEELEEALGLPQGKVSELRRLTIPPVSLNVNIKTRDEKGSRPLSELVGDGGSVEQCVLAEADDCRHAVDYALKGLTERERELISLRYGFGGEEPKSLDDVARELGLAAERAKQIEFKALARLRSAIGQSSRQICA